MVAKFLTAKVTCENGYQWTTPINGTVNDIARYFLGRSVNTAPYPNEVFSKAVKCIVTDLNGTQHYFELQQ